MNGDEPQTTNASTKKPLSLRVIQGKPSGAAYSYLAAAAVSSAVATCSGGSNLGEASRESSMCVVECPTRLCSAATETVFTWSTGSTERNPKAASLVAVDDATIQRTILELTQSHVDDGEAEAEVEARLQLLEATLEKRSKGFAVADGASPAHRAQYSSALADVKEASRCRQERADAIVAARAKAVELAEMTVYCRETILLQRILKIGLLKRDIERIEERDATLQSFIEADAEAREKRRQSNAEASERLRREREERYTQCADPVLRQMRFDANRRREEESQADAAQEEAELQSLERRVASLLGTAERDDDDDAEPDRSSASARAAVAQGSVPYWKRKVSKASDSSPGPSIVSPSHDGSAGVVAAEEVSHLLQVIQLAAEEREEESDSNAACLSRGLGLLLSGIDV